MNKECSDIFKVSTLEKTHKKRKNEIGFRLEVSRILIRRYYQSKRDLYSEDDFSKHCEAVLDNVLCRFNYDNEMIIEKWRAVAPTLKQSPGTCEKCDYRPVFCRC